VREALGTLVGEGTLTLLECKGERAGSLGYLVELLAHRFRVEIEAEQPARALVASLRELVPTHEVVEVSVAVAVLLGIELPSGNASLASLRGLLEDPVRRRPFVADILRRLLRRETERGPLVIYLHAPDGADAESRGVLGDVFAALKDAPILVIAEQCEFSAAHVSGPRRFLRATTSPGTDETAIDLPVLTMHSQRTRQAIRDESGAPDLDASLLSTAVGDPWADFGEFPNYLDQGDENTVLIDGPREESWRADTVLFGLPCQVVPVEPLADLQMDSLARRVLRSVDDLPDALVGMLLTASAGIPGRLEHGIAALVSYEVLAPGEDGVWRADIARLMGDDLPADLEQLSLSRLRALPAKHRYILELASIVGERFRFQEVLALMRLDQEPGEIAFFERRTENRLRRVLLELTGQDVVLFESGSGAAGDEVFRFRFERERELLCAGVAPDRRRSLHRVFAQILDQSGAPAATVADHWRRGDADRRAALALLREGVALAESFRVQSAVEILEAALAELGVDEGEEILTAMARLASCQLSLAAYERVDTICAQLAQAAYAMGLPQFGARAFLLQGIAGRERGNLDDAFLGLERALELVRKESASAARKLEAEILDEMVTNRWSRGAHFSEALALADQALAVRREMGDSAGTAQTLLYIGQIQCARSRVDEARSFFEQAEQLAKAEGLTPVLARARNALGVAAYYARDFDRAHKYWSEVLEMSQEIGDRALRTSVLNNLGEMASRRGSIREAAEYLHRAVELARSIGEHRVCADSLRHLAEIALGEDELDQAAGYAEQAIDEARRSGVRSSVARSLRTVGVVGGRAVLSGAASAGAGGVVGRTHEVERSFQESMTLLEAMGNDAELRHTCDRYAEFLRAVGRETEAAEIERSRVG
jgi:tetratricopeptide (TPR) repeat protein